MDIKERRIKLTELMWRLEETAMECGEKFKVFKQSVKKREDAKNELYDYICNILETIERLQNDLTTNREKIG